LGPCLWVWWPKRFHPHQFVFSAVQVPFSPEPRLFLYVLGSPDPFCTPESRPPFPASFPWLVPPAVGRRSSSDLLFFFPFFAAAGGDPLPFFSNFLHPPAVECSPQPPCVPFLGSCQNTAAQTPNPHQIFSFFCLFFFSTAGAW